MVPQTFIGEMMELCNEHRGIELEYKFVESTDRAVLRYQLPLSEIATEFFSSLKSRYVERCSNYLTFVILTNPGPWCCTCYRSKGYASFDYEDAGYAPSDLVKVRRQYRAYGFAQLTRFDYRFS
jgi:translation elongation factor EF-4